MGEVRAQAKLRNAATREPGVEASLLVDTGAVLVLLPQDMVEALRLDILDKAIVALANDQKIEMSRAGPLRVTVAGRTTTTDCLVGPPGCEPLLGQVVLESLDLVVDPLKQTITPRPESPFLPTLKMK